MAGGRRLFSPVAGVEREYLLLSPRDADEGSRGPSRAQELAEERIYRAGNEEGIGYILRPWPGPWKTLRRDGGAWGLEEHSILEVSTPETADGIEAVSYLRASEASMRLALAGMEDAPACDAFLTCTPACMTRFEPGNPRQLWLGFHLNLFLPLDWRQRRQLASWLALLSPLISAGGGLTERGLVLSPAGCRVGDTLGYGMEARPSLVEVKPSPLFMEERLDSGYFRLHLPCFDAPLSARRLALSFASVQVVAALVFLRECLPELILANPARAMAAISSSPLLAEIPASRRFRLEGGRMITHAEAMAAALGGLEEARKRFYLDPLRELAVERLAAGIRAWPRGGEELAEDFDFFTRAAVHRQALELQGVTPAWFDRVAVPVIALASRMGGGILELARSSPREARSLLRRGGSEHQRERLRSLLRERRLSPQDIPFLARAVRRLRSLELRLGEVFPGRSPLAAWDDRTWEDLVRRASSPRREPNRADARSELVCRFASLGERVQATWDHLFFFPPGGGVGVITLPHPASPKALPFRWLSEEEQDEYAEARPMEINYMQFVLRHDREGRREFEETLAELLRDESVRSLWGGPPLLNQLRLF
ncbi:MAG: hypothetical protein H5T74_13450 [Actinobacteria bacterium]|nr:hypothetical protein [Actinomycetota bacterium]